MSRAAISVIFVEGRVQKKLPNFGHCPNLRDPPSSLDTKSLDTREVVRPPPLPPKSLDTKSLKVYIRSASCVDKVLIVVVYERLEVSINVTIMISTIGMVHQLPFYAKRTNFFTQFFLDKCPNFFLKKRVLSGV